MSTKHPSAKNHPKEKAISGRPTIFSESVAAEICERIATGESVRQICLLEHMPAERTLYSWLLKHEDFQKRYATAKSFQADLFAEELLEIADDSRNDWIQRENERTGAVTVVFNDEAVSRSKLRIESRKWLMSKFKPKRYGDKVELEHSGAVHTTITLAEGKRTSLFDRRRKAIEAGRENPT